jgi:hypothetical protein
MRLNIALAAIILVGCADSSDYAEPPRPDGTLHLAFYLVDEPPRITSPITADELEGLTLRPTPILTEKDITKYVWNVHRFEVTEDALGRLDEIEPLPFVVTVGEERVYVGTFWPAESSLKPGIPHISVHPKGPGSKGHRAISPLTIDWLRIAECTCTDPRVQAALEAAGIPME